MEDAETEIADLKHNFWQLVNLTRSLQAKNQVLKARIKENESTYNWSLAEMNKEADDLKHKNLVLMKKLNLPPDEDYNVVSQDYHQVLQSSVEHSQLQAPAEPSSEEEEAPDIPSDSGDSLSNKSV